MTQSRLDSAKLHGRSLLIAAAFLHLRPLPPSPFLLPFPLRSPINLTALPFPSPSPDGGRATDVRARGRGGGGRDLSTRSYRLMPLYDSARTLSPTLLSPNEMKRGVSHSLSVILLYIIIIVILFILSLIYRRTLVIKVTRLGHLFLVGLNRIEIARLISLSLSRARARARSRSRCDYSTKLHARSCELRIFTTRTIHRWGSCPFEPACRTHVCNTKRM